MVRVGGGSRRRGRDRRRRRIRSAVHRGLARPHRQRAGTCTVRPPRQARGPSNGKGSVMSADTIEHRNEVLLVGRLSAAPEQRVLPSGDEITVWRLVVAREDVSGGGGAQEARDPPAGAPRAPKGAAAWEAGDAGGNKGARR